MKKSLIALAILAVSGAAMAQSSVTLYGVVDVNINSAKDANGVRQTKVGSGGLNGSRWGIKGSEDLGGGLKANFVAESGFTADDGKGNAKGLFNRQSYVSLSGAFGEVQLGNTYSAMDDIYGNAHAVFDTDFAPTALIDSGYEGRPLNNIRFNSANYGGISGAVSYSLGENKTATTSAKNVFSLHVKYEGGPLYVGYGYQRDERRTLGGKTSINNMINGTYDLGVVKLMAGWSNIKNATFEKENVLTFGVDVPVGPALVLTAGIASTTGKTNGFADTKETGFGLGAKYDLSKRTALYAGLNHTEIKVANSKAKTDMYGAGIRHSF